MAPVTELVERYVRVQARVRDWVAAMPIWFWLATLVLVSAAVRLELALSDPGPWIFSDELYYAELAKSSAAGGFALREVSVDALSLGPVYPLLIAPAFAFFERIPDAYDAARAINAVVMSLAALPAYLLARRVLGVLHSLGAALLTVALPSMLYTTVIMTENAFYPVFLTCALVMALALERPTALRQLAVLALVLIAVLTRRQGIVLLPAYGTAMFALAMAEGLAVPAPSQAARWKAVLELLRKFALTLVVLLVGAAGFLVYQLARGRSPTDSLLGAYAGLSDQQYSPEGVFRWSLYHLSELDLYLGFAPLAALLLVAGIAFGRGRLSTPRLRVFAALSISLVVWFTVAVGAFASVAGVNRIEERNLFYIAPLFFIALLVWVNLGLPRPWPGAAVAVLVVAVLPTLLPFGSLLNETAVSDTLGLLPFWDVAESPFLSGDVTLLVVLVSVAVGTLLLLLPVRFALVLPALVLAYLVVIHGPIERRSSEASASAVENGIGRRPDWIDRLVGPHAEVAALWSADEPPVTLWENDFFNRAVGPVYNFGNFPDGLPQQTLVLEPATGIVRLQSGEALRSRYVLVDRTMNLDGRVVSGNRAAGAGMRLYEASQPVTIRERITGLYADGWSGPEMVYTRYGCKGGVLVLILIGSNDLRPSPARVVARSEGRMLAQTLVGEAAERFRIPLRPAGGVCEVKLAVSPVVVPADILAAPDPRASDIRPLGVRARAFTYVESG
jgi:hypothetical protein